MTTIPSPIRRLAVVAALAGAALSLVSCGDDESSADLDEFCAVARQLNEQDDLPSPDQLAEYQSLAPDEIAEPTATLVASFEAAGADPRAVFADDASLAAIAELTAFEAERCGIEPPEAATSGEVDPDAVVVDVTATEYALDLADPTGEGPHSFVMTNEGAEPHLLVVARLEPDAVLDDVLAADGEVGVVQAVESEVAPPGGEAVVTVDLVPGRWVVVCPIPNDAGESHAELGMVREFTVG